MNLFESINCEKCLICGEKFKVNGIGPTGNSELTKFLHALPSSHIFYIAASIHDVLYHYKLNDVDRKKADNIFLIKMLELSEKKGGSFCWWYKAQAYRNYWSVRLFGKRYIGSCNPYV